MLAKWLMAKPLSEVAKQEQIICRNKIQAKVHKIRLNLRLKGLLRRPDALGIVFLSGCAYGSVGKKTTSSLSPLLSLALTLFRAKSMIEPGN